MNYFLIKVSLISAAMLIFLSACTKNKSMTMIEEKCATCHPYEKIYGGRPSERWPEIISRMREMNPALLSPEEASSITKYLQEDFKG
jgi:hypothetical protein